MKTRPEGENKKLDPKGKIKNRPEGENKKPTRRVN
jgi:hypothetical protein